ncbi:hypothetical protein TWF106_008238 [Orbilia oligospora]|uniref:Myb-like DNA-binding domain-containing protein n=1 Tax=Orbilia oligospora TaxID=2813651 RepID=A0A7C8UYL8_ORBOL|nr:hypothetical protein TWF106_008238 [Orbilia oligospora]
MAPKNPSADDQFLFLISCVKNSNNGKPDFSLVAKERGIVSRGAAAKRFSRMMAAHGISGSLSGGQTSLKKGPKSSPMTEDEEKEKSEESQGEIKFQEVKVEELANTSKKRKRGGQQQQTPRKRAGRKAKSAPVFEENEEGEEEEGGGEETGEDE